MNEINIIIFKTNDPIPYILNIILFMPLGFLLPFLWESLRNNTRVLFIGLIFSLTIEVSQLFNHRTTDIDDLIMNTFGSVLGYFLWLCIFKCFVYLVKNKNLVAKNKEHMSAFRYEACIYILLAFGGTFFLYNARLLY